MTDIKLENDHVVVEGRLKIEGAELSIEGNDIKLDKEDRRNRSNRSRYRRAVVHGHQDQLILNYDNDYLGIEINGSKSEGIKLKGDVSINSIDIQAVINTLQETVVKLLENQSVLEERIRDLEIKVGIRPTRVLENFLSNHDVQRNLNIRIPRA